MELNKSLKKPLEEKIDTILLDEIWRRIRAIEDTLTTQRFFVDFEYTVNDRFKFYLSKLNNKCRLFVDMKTPEVVISKPFSDMPREVRLQYHLHMEDFLSQLTKWVKDRRNIIENMLENLENIDGATESCCEAAKELIIEIDKIAQVKNKRIEKLEKEVE